MFCDHVLARVEADAQVAIVEGWDTNATPNDLGAERRSAPFSGVEATLGVRASSRWEHATSIRALGRLQVYTPPDASFDQKDGFVALTLTDLVRIGRLTRWSNVGTFTLGSVQASRGTDAAPIAAFDPFSRNRVGWMGTWTTAWFHEIDRTLEYRSDVGVSAGGTLREDLVGFGTRRDEPDFLSVSGHLGVRARTSPRTVVEPRVFFDRTRMFFLLEPARAPDLLARNAGPIDAASATPSVRITHGLGRTADGTLELGATLAWPVIGESARLLPFAQGTLVDTHDSWTLRADATLAFNASDLRLGPALTASTNVYLIVLPVAAHAFRGVSAIATASASRSELLAGPTSSSAVNGGGAGASVRVPIVAGIALLLGYDGRVSAVVGANVPTYVRHLVFVGIAGAWSTDRAPPPVTTLVLTPPA